MKGYKSLQLETLVYRINTGNVQLAYNVSLNLQILVIAKNNELSTEYDYNVIFIRGEEVVKTIVMGMTNKIGYYSAKDIARQYTHLPSELKLN
jgi:hypothetical protein